MHADHDAELTWFVEDNHINAPAYALDLCRRALTSFYDDGSLDTLIALPKEAFVPCAEAMDDDGTVGLAVGFIFEMFHLWDLLPYWGQKWRDEERE